MILSLIESCLRGIGGRAGRYLRFGYYKLRLRKCGRGVFIDTGVHLINPSRISLEDGVWVDKNVILIAGALPLKAEKVKRIENLSFQGIEGEIHVGAYSHIGLMTVIQGHGGVRLGRYCTTSAGVKIYSLSNDPKKCPTGTMKDPAYIIHPVEIGENVWLGINVTVLGHTIRDNAFVKSHHLVYSDIPYNRSISHDHLGSEQKDQV